MAVSRVIRLGLTAIFCLIGLSLCFVFTFDLVVPRHRQGEIIYSLFPALHPCNRKNTPENIQFNVRWDTSADARLYINQLDSTWVPAKTLTVGGVFSFNDPVLSTDGMYLLVRAGISPLDECTIVYHIPIDGSSTGSRVYLPDFTLSVYGFGVTADDVYLGTRNSQVLAWSLGDNRLTTHVRVPAADLWLSALSSDAQFAVFQNHNGVQVWDVNSIRRLDHFELTTSLAVLSRDGARLLIHDLDEEFASVRDTQTGDVLTSFSTSDGAADFQFTRLADYIIFNDMGDVVVLDSHSGEQIATHEVGSLDFRLADMALQADDDRLAVLACSQTDDYPCAISILSIPSLQVEEQISGLAETYSVRLVDANTLLTVHPDGRLVVWTQE